MAASEAYHLHQERIKTAGNPFPKRGQIKQRIKNDIVVILESLAPSKKRRMRNDADGGGVGGGGEGGEGGSVIRSPSSSNTLTGNFSG